MNNLMDLTPQQLRRAANLKDRLASLQKQLSQILGAPAQAQNAAAPRRKWKMSAASKAKISAAATARWAKIKGKKLSVKPVKQAKRTMSAAARERLAQLAKARWAKVKAAGKKRL